MTKALSTLSQKSENVAEKCDCRRKRRDNSEIRRQSHFIATVSLFCDKLSHFSATVWTGFKTVAAKLRSGSKHWTVVHISLLILESRQLSMIEFNKLTLAEYHCPALHSYC